MSSDETVVKALAAYKAIAVKAQSLEEKKEDGTMHSGDSLNSAMQSAVKDLWKILEGVRHSTLPWTAIINITSSKLKNAYWDFHNNRFISSSGGTLTVPLVCSAWKECVKALNQWIPDTTGHSRDIPLIPVEHEDLDEMKKLWPVDYPAQPCLRVIPDDFPRRVYRARGKEGKEKGRHWGQRKLMMNEIELLTMHAQPGDVVVYAGSAPGHHIAFLSSEMFPEVTFVLVDPAPFKIKASEKITLINDLFTDELAQKYSGQQNVIFISDIRRTFESEELIVEDMMDQQRWHDIMKPKISMFKFRLPWYKGTTEYLNGEVFIQPYCPMQSTETRLIVSGHAKKQWDHVVYEQQCFFFNTVNRMQDHEHGVTGAGLDPKSYDAAAEVHILRRYLQKYSKTFHDLDQIHQNREIAKLSIRITHSIGIGPAFDWLKRCDSSLLIELGIKTRGYSSYSEDERHSSKPPRHYLHSSSKDHVGYQAGGKRSIPQGGLTTKKKRERETHSYALHNESRNRSPKRYKHV
jgi:hypothetical protein